MGKVSRIQALLVDNFWENLWNLWMNKKNLSVFTHKWPQVCIIYPRLMYSSSQIPNVLENIEIYVNFVWLGNVWLCGHFFTWKIDLQTKSTFSSLPQPQSQFVRHCVFKHQNIFPIFSAPTLSLPKHPYPQPCSNFEVVFIFQVVFIFEVVFNLRL